MVGILDRFLDKPIRNALVLLALVTFAFGVFYYFDRYYSAQPTMPEQATNRLEQAVVNDPNDPAARLALAQSYMQQRRYQDAVAQLEQVVAVQGNSDRALNLMATAYLNLGDRPRAKELFQKVVTVLQDMENKELTKSLPAAHYRLGQMALEDGDYQAALDNLTKATNLNPIDADALVGLGKVYLALGRTDDAVTVLAKAASMVPDYVEAYVTLGAALEKRGEGEAAAWAYGEALKWDKYNGEAQAGLSRVKPGS